MPYIKPKDRVEIDKLIDELIKCAYSPGEINYAITKFLHGVIIDTGLKYVTLNGIIGVLECVKLEIYQQVVRKYENQKKLENGPVSELDK